MHPEIVKDGPGACDICGMDLVPAESLGYVAVREQDAGPPLVVPAAAVLITGRRAVAYVEVPNAPEPTYEGREVVLGPRAGAFYLVRGGLTEGERVVVEGNFKIDSALQIQARPSMMSPAPQPATRPATPPAAEPSAATRPAGDHAAHGAAQPATRPAAHPVAQTRCPVMGAPINRDYCVDYQGRRIYFCCPGCDKVFRQDPAKYLRKLDAQLHGGGHAHE
jgi:YHS domain-containing protein